MHILALAASLLSCYHCPCKHKPHKVVTVPVVETFQFPAVTRHLPLVPTPTAPLHDDLGTVTFPGPYAGSVHSVQGLAYEIPFYVDDEIFIAPPVNFSQPNPYITMTVEVKVGTRIVANGTQLVTLPLTRTFSAIPSTDGQFSNYVYHIDYTRVRDSIQFNPAIRLLPSESITVDFGVDYNLRGASPSSEQDGYFIFGYDPVIGNVPNPAQMTGQLSYQVITVNPKRSTHGPVY